MDGLSHETERLAAVDRCCILDTPPSPYFDRIARLAAQFFCTPMAVITFVGRGRSWFKSCYGIALREIQGAESFCEHTILGQDPLVVSDASADGRFSGFGIVAGSPGVRFYAGVPLIAAGGFAVGTFAVMDTLARPPLLEAELTALRDFSALVEEELKRRSTAPAAHTTVEYIENALPAIVYTSDALGRTTFATRFWREFSGDHPDHPVHWLDAIHSDDRAHALAVARAGRASKSDIVFECRFRRADGEYRWMIHDARPQFHSDGTFAGYAGICVDITEWKQVERALRESEERLRVAAENAGDIIYQWDVQEDRVTVVGDYSSRLGYNPDETPRSFEEWIRLLHPDDRERCSAALHRTLAEDAPLREEYRTIRHDGVVHYWSDRASLVRDRSGHPHKVIGAVQNITERKRIEEDLALLASIVECSQDAIVSITLDGHILTWNPAAARLLGYSAADVRGRSIDMIIPPDHAEEIPEILRKAAQGETILHHETVRVRKDGSHVPVSLSISAIRNPEGKPIAVSAILQDISALKEAEAARREGEEWIELAQDLAGLGIWDFDLRKKSGRCSEQCYRLFGLTPRESPLSLTEWLSMIHPHDRKRMSAFDEHMVRGRDQIDAEFRVVRPDGSVRSALSKAKLYHDAGGQPVRILGVALDITDMKKAEEARRASEERYENLFRSITQGVLYLGSEGEILSANPAAEEILGLTADEMRGRRRSDFHLAEVREDGTPLTPEAYPSLHALRTGSEVHDVLVGVRNVRTQERHWVLIDALPQFRPAETRPYGSVVVFQDITRRVNAQAGLRASEERFRHLIEHGLELIGILDPDGTIRYVSPSVERVLGYAWETLLGRNAADYTHPDDIQLLLGSLCAILQSPAATTQNVYRIRHRDGSWHLMEAAATNLTHIEALNGIVVNARDISAQKRHEQELLDSRNRLRQLAAYVESAREHERTRIAREIHDELGQMLTALKLDLEGLASKYRPTPANAASRKEFFERVASMVCHIDTSIDSVRKISAELRPGILDHLGLPAALEWQINEFRSLTGLACRSKGVNVDPHLGPEQSTAAFRIFQEILTNIARHAEATAVNIEAATDSGWFTLSVADNGRGMPPDALSDPRSLGLLGMRERALLLGGAVSFSERRGGGAIVSVRLPAGPSEALSSLPAPLNEQAVSTSAQPHAASTHPARRRS